MLQILVLPVTADFNLVEMTEEEVAEREMRGRRIHASRETLAADSTWTSCRDNEVMAQLASKLPATRSAALGHGLAAVSGADGTLIAFATQPNRVAADGQGRNSPFTAALLKNLPTPGLDVRILMTRVRAEVVASTGGAQRPEVWDSLLGEFAFKAAP